MIWTSAPEARGLIQAALVLAFTAAASLLIIGGRHDAAAAHLGGFFALIAGAFADAFARRSGADEWFIVRSLIATRLDAFLPAFLWLFLACFPRVRDGQARRGCQLAAAGATVMGIALLVANAFADPGRPDSVAWHLSRTNSGSAYWPILMGSMLPAAPMLFHRARHAAGADRRRLVLFVAAITAGLLPMTVDVILVAVMPGYAALTAGPARLAIETLAYLALLSVPFTTAYAVVVHQVVDVQVLVRMAVRYALAKYTLVGVTVLPFLVTGVLVARQRESTVGALFSGATLPWLTLGLAIGGLLVASRRRLLDAIDRWCFREQYDAQLILNAVVDRVRDTAGVDELTALLCQDVDRALHLERIDVMVTDATGTWLQASRQRGTAVPVASLSPLIVGRDAAPIDVAPDASRSGSLAPLFREWPAAAGTRLIVPLRGADDALLGILLLGAKRSELPFSREDRLLLGSIGTAAALFLENRRMRESRGLGRLAAAVAAGRDDREESALECDVCRVVHPLGSLACPCGGPLVPAPVPRLLGDKFRFDCRIGEGGMGIVYKVTDLDLRRPVAIKMLPMASTENALRLQREAQAMASMSHPNLAVVFGLESWKGSPLLIVEYLSGGTLAERLERAPLSLVQAIDLGLTLADALAHIHAAGMLHRDIKPSNIGFTATGVPKLLDFGLVRLMETWWPQDAGQGLGRAATAATTAWADANALTRQLMVGTPAYMSPEAVRREHPDIRVDLWGVMVVLFECITGHNPYRRGSLGDTFTSIVDGSVQTIEMALRDCPAPIRAFFRDGLAPDVGRRPQSAERLHDRLVALRASLQEA